MEELKVVLLDTNTLEKLELAPNDSGLSDGRITPKEESRKLQNSEESTMSHLCINEVAHKESHVGSSADTAVVNENPDLEKTIVYSVIKDEVNLEESERTPLDINTDSEEELPVNVSKTSGTEVDTVISEIIFLNDPDHEQFIDECLTSDISEESTVEENQADGSRQTKSQALPVPHLQQFVNQYNSRRTIKCDVYNKIFTKSIHDRIKHQCDESIKVLPQTSYMPHHKLHHTSIKKYTCDVCNISFAEAMSLSLHKLIHRYQCNMCKKKFTKETSLLTHKTVSQCVKEHRCDLCNKVFSEAKYLLQHKSVHSGIKYKCDVCYKDFTQIRSLIDHKLLHTGIKKYKCEVCNKAFAQSSGLFVHKLIHNRIEKYKCDVCNKGFIRSFHLSMHKLTHSVMKKYKCGICNRAFTRSDHLSRHMLRHTGIKRYECGVCNEAFTYKRYLTKHILLHSNTEKC